MTRVSKAESARIRAAARKARRAEKARENALLDAMGSSQEADGTIRVPPPPKRKRRKPSARKRAFLELKANRDEFVKLRGKYRTGGRCEVAMPCGGQGNIEVVYHVFPAAMGNAIKHDPRNLLAACSRCNGAEYFARKRGDSERFHARHRAILGESVWTELRDLQGRKQITTAEAREMAAEYRRKIEAGEWRQQN